MSYATQGDSEAMQPYESESARYIRVRAEAKAQAAVTMATAAKAAKEAKEKRLRRRGAADSEIAEFNRQAKSIEEFINAKPATSEKEV